MRQLSGRLNRTWLAVIGIILLLTGLVGGMIALGLLNRALAATGVGVTGPPPADRVLPTGTAGFLDQPVVVAGVGVLGVVLGIIGLAWLLAQIPRTNAAKPFRLHDDARRGLTVCDPDVLTHAVEADTEALPGVTHADAILRGTAAQPELTLKVTANDRADVRELVHALQTEIAGHLAVAMETPVRHLAAQVDITTSRRTADSVTL